MLRDPFSQARCVIQSNADCYLFQKFSCWVESGIAIALTLEPGPEFGVVSGGLSEWTSPSIFFFDLRSLMAKKKTAKKTKRKAAKPNPCWDGYEPTPGKKPGSKGSCRLKKK